MTADELKIAVARAALPHVVEGELLGVGTGSTVKHFGSADEADAFFDAMTEEGMVENARDIGAQVLGPGLKKLAERYPMIGEARGVGLFWALEFVSDVQHRTPMPAPVMQEMKAALALRGLLSFVVENRIHVVPPCIVSAAQVNEALAIFDEVFALFAPRFA